MIQLEPQEDHTAGKGPGFGMREYILGSENPEADLPQQSSVRSRRSAGNLALS